MTALVQMIAFSCCPPNHYLTKVEKVGASYMDKGLRRNLIDTMILSIGPLGSEWEHIRANFLYNATIYIRKNKSDLQRPQNGL